MSDIVIKAENLGKKYTIGHQASSGRYVALRDVVMQNARSLWRTTKDLVRGKPIIQGDDLEEVWALKDVNFEIRRGEAVGIIGRNGAGKSTLLKVLSRITEPSAGRVTIRGRVSSLLEVGTGFHPELTGRENIYLNGAILGMTRTEIKRKFDEIVGFSGVERFLDTPVKRYSSGMYVRLAFAVAAHLEPEILLVDEVLAVGDAEFQGRCLGKMKDVSECGRTVLFVSHNMGAIQSLCTRAIHFDSGVICSEGKVDEQISRYLASSGYNTVGPEMPNQLAPGFELRELALSPSPVVSGSFVDIRISFGASGSSYLEDIALLIYSSLGARVAVLDLRRLEGSCETIGPDGLTIERHLSSLPLVEGIYSIGLYLRGTYVSGDFLDLTKFRVHPRKENNRPAPYPSEVRGVLDLSTFLKDRSADIGIDIKETASP